MSHQVTADTKLTDRDLVASALTDLGFRYTEKDGHFDCGHRTDGVFGIDTKTGKVNYGYSNRKEVGDLFMYYNLAAVKRQASIEGQVISNIEQKVVNGKRCLELTVVK